MVCVFIMLGLMKLGPFLLGITNETVLFKFIAVELTTQKQKVVEVMADW